MSKVVLVLSPNKNVQEVARALEETLYRGGAFQPLPNVLDVVQEGKVYVSINPNAAEMNDILNLPDTKIVIQNHSIGEISRVSGDMFLADESESLISEFTRLQHQYKRLVTMASGQDAGVHLIETPIGSVEELQRLGDEAINLIPVPVAVEPEPVPTATTDEPLIDFDAEAEAVDEGETPVPVEVEEPVPVENPEPVVEELPEVQVEEPVAVVPQPDQTEATQVLDESPLVELEPEFDPLASLDAPEASMPEPERSEPAAPVKGEDDFAEALLNSLQEAQAPTVNETDLSVGEEKVAPAFGIPVEYPNVDQTVTFDKDKLFKPSESDDDFVLNDWAGDTAHFNQIHARLSDRLGTAINKGIDPNFSDFENAVLMYGEDQVSVPEMHKFQYVDKARWGGSINSPTTAVPIIMPIRNPNYGDAKYVGPESVSLLQNRMKIGCKLGVFLPHTGIYFIIISPGDDRFLDTLSVINNQRIVALRSSSGILLGNSNFYINRQVVNLFLDSIVHCSLGGWNREQLMKLIDERDVNIIASALGASIYPDGYEYVQACGQMKTDNKVCTHLTRKLVDLRRMVFVDNTRLSEQQKLHAAGALKERSIKEIQDYQEANYIGYKKPYEITEGVEFVYRAQSAITSIEAGEKWIKEIEAIVDNIITFREDDETRNNMIDQRIALTRIREYAHWVEDILVDGQPLGDRDKINKLLNSLSRKKEVVDKVGNTLTEFQRLASVAMVAVPRIQCPACEKTEERDLDISTHLIPQDAVSRLFTLVRQRL